MKIEYHTFPAGTILYRASIKHEKHVKPRYCNDTGKTGTYFAANCPILSESMVLEYHCDLEVAKYVLIKSIRVVIGKYTLKDYSHCDPEIVPLCSDITPPSYSYELFLTPVYYRFIKYIGYYKYTFRQGVKKYPRNWIYYDMYPSVKSFKSKQYHPSTTSQQCSGYKHGA